MKYKYWNTPDSNNDRMDTYNDKSKRAEISTVACKCGNNDFMINALPAPYTGGFIKLTCSSCGKSDVLMDDFS